ncbi:MAG: GNAT family N-acetyltransferase [Gammaproteobacteria bacterium]|nr:GNAT family N-acetyltransferase [Gammaproteobacteria bacterium]
MNESYWGKGRTREMMDRCIAHSLCFGGYRDGEQIAFGRLVTDRCLIGYLADVFVATEHRGQGIGRALMAHVLAHPDVSGLQVVLLRTADAQGFYRSLGFDAVPRTQELMGLYRSPTK